MGERLFTGGNIIRFLGVGALILASCKSPAPTENRSNPELTPVPITTPVKSERPTPREMADELISAPLGPEKRRNYTQAITVLHDVVKEFINPRIAQAAGLGDNFFQDILISDDKTMADFIKTHSNIGQAGWAFFGNTQTWNLLVAEGFYFDMTITTTPADRDTYDPHDFIKLSRELTAVEIQAIVNLKMMPGAELLDPSTAYGLNKQAKLAFDVFNLPSNMLWSPITKRETFRSFEDGALRGLHIDRGTGRLTEVDVEKLGFLYFSISEPSARHFPPG